MGRPTRRFISGSIRGVLAPAALAGACLGRAGQVEPEPGGVLRAPRQNASAAPFVAAPNPVQPGGGPLLARITAEKRHQYRALLVSELRFCRIACDLTKEQSQQIVRRIGPLVERAAELAGKLDLKPMQRGGIRLATDPAPPNPIKLVGENLLKLVKELTTSAQQSRYQVELEKRDVHRRQAALHDVVARLDRMLILSGDQRAQISRLLDSNWDDEWGEVSYILGQDGTVFPAIPSRLIVPCLSSTQEMLWNKCSVVAIDATSAYLSVLSECTANLPCEFSEWLESAAVEDVKRRIVPEAGNTPGDRSP